MKLSQEQRTILGRMRAENSSAGFPYTAEPFWQNENKNFDSAFKIFGINTVEDEIYNTRFSGVTRKDHRLFDWFMWQYYNTLKQRDSLNLIEKLSATIPDQPAYLAATGQEPVALSEPVWFDGKKISPDLLFSIDDFYNLYEINPAVATEKLVVCDLGSGWGRIGHVLAQANPNITYLATDLPEALLICSTYLPRLLPHVSQCSYEQSKAYACLDHATLEKHTLWFLGSHDLQRVETGAIDIFINVASFQEMPIPQVNAYLEIVDRVASGGSLYIRNLWRGLDHHFDDNRIPTDWKKIFLRNTRYSAHFYEAGFHIPKK